VCAKGDMMMVKQNEIGENIIFKNSPENSSEENKNGIPGASDLLSYHRKV